MKLVTVFIMAAILIAPSIGQCWVNDVVFVRGKVNEVNENEIRVTDGQKNVMVIPRMAIAKAYKVTTQAAVSAIPVLSSQIKNVKWVRGDSKVDLTYPKMTSAQIERRLASAIEKAKN